MSALNPIASLPAFATGTITTDNTEVADNATMSIGGKTYTIKASGASADGEVNKGASADATLTNLAHAINLDGTPGAYGASMVVNPLVKVNTLVPASHVLTLVARVPGVDGNAIALGAAPTHWTRSGALFTGGTDSISTALGDILRYAQCNAEVIVALTALGAS